MSTIFTKIIQGEIPSYKVAENKEFYAFLDISPVAKGHTLVVPRQEVDYIFDLDDDLLSRMMVFSKKVSSALEKVVSCKRVGLTVIGLEVPHAHIHLIPINEEADIYFNKKRPVFSQDELKRIAKDIAEAFKE